MRTHATTLFAVVAIASAASADSQFFETRIRPVLAEHCFSCHGPDRADGGLRLHNEAAFQKGGARGTILPYNDDVGLIDYVVENQADFEHPAVELTAEHVRDIRAWVRGGADWPKTPPRATPDSMEAFIAAAKREHWSFQPVADPTVPDVEDDAWARSSIDRFVLAKLDAAGLSPSPMAEPRALLRRAFLDLTGLPPSFEQVQAFERDPSWEAYARVIDDLLASPRYGERWGRYWLDVARYSDTRGYGRGNDRYFPFPHTYRDYVIRAFNEDLPYDQFIVEQLAADKLDLGDDKRPLAALGFITLGRQFPGDRNATLDDQIDVVTRGLQGLTVSCARCHDHKFDPVSIADYYSLYGIFRSSHVPGELPLIGEPDSSSELYREYAAELEKRQRAVDSYLEQIHIEALSDARDRVGEYLNAAYDTMALKDPEEFRREALSRDLSWPLVQRWTKHLQNDEQDPVFGLWRALAAIERNTFGARAAEVIREYLDSDKPLAGPIRTHFLDASPESMLDVNEFFAKLLNGVDREWKDVLAARSQLSGDAPWPIALDDPEREVVRLALYGPDSPANIPADQVERFCNAEVRQKIAARRAAVREHMGSHPGRPDRAMALADSRTPYDPYVFVRGKEGTRGDDVPRRYLSVLSTDGREAYTDGSGRLELARAIASEDNPLTARVLVNRAWMHHFGQALVDTPSDYGYQGNTPTHPELLDYLATTFVEDGWSLKRLHKRIMLSSTYVQSSATRDDAVELDPENKLYWHYARRRLDFEAMRDGMLAAAEHLDYAMGGLSFDLTALAFPSRRTVYAEIDRQDLPDVFPTFDFAAPGAHSSRRFETTVPPQALYLLNNEFVAEQARSLGASAAHCDDTEAGIQHLYRRIFQRDPTARELELGIAFQDQIKTARPVDAAPPHEASDWLYGYGAIDEETGHTASFSEFNYWSGDSYQRDGHWPDGEGGFAQLTKLGGHPGDADHSVIRRWTSPVDSQISFIGELHHYSSLGDGIRGYVISSREGIIWSGDVQDGMILSEFQGHPIKKGDTVDLVVASKGESKEDRFRWHPRLYLSGPDSAQYPKQDWLTRFDFMGPPPPSPEPLDAWAQYAQVLLMSNEFMYVD